MSAGREGLERLAKGVAEAADAWGWKGGKPGELTGGAYQERLDDLYNSYNTYDEIERERWENAEIALRDKMDDIINAQVDKSKNPNLKRAFNNTGNYVEKFTMDMQALEDAGIPREWTGKVWPAIQSQLQYRYDFIPPILAQQVSDLMSRMTNEQRQTFVNLLPRWTGTLEAAASAARKMYRR